MSSYVVHKSVKASVQVESYFTDKNTPGQVLTRMALEEFEIYLFSVGSELWIGFDGGPQGMPWLRVPETFEDGWYAQAGSKPVYIARTPACNNPYGCCGHKCQAGWGGRNYPRYFISGDEMRKIYEELS